MDKRDIYLWLNKTPGIGNVKLKAIESYFENIEEVYTARRETLSKIKALRDVDITRLMESRSKTKLEDYKEQLMGLGISYITKVDKNYPQCFNDIFDPPYLFYYIGELDALFNRVRIAVVGARRCSAYGKHVSYEMSKSLSNAGITIVSGMARGVDTQAHKGALDGKSQTVAVLGSGLDICYPKENKELMDAIIKKGCVISEYPIGTPPLSGNFPRRNRLISGLSHGIVVTEAARKSGSIITADVALEQGKDVYAVPGSIYSKTSQGTNWLLKQGARVLTDPEDILMDYGVKNHESMVNSQIKLQIELAKDEKMIYDNLGLEPLHIDVLCKMTNFPIIQVQHILTLLEIEGYIQQLPGKRFIKKM